MSGKRVAAMTPQELEHARAQRRAAQARYRVTAAGKAAAHRYWISEKGRENSRRNKDRNLINWRDGMLERQRERNAEAPEKAQAQRLVNYAVKRGWLTRPDSCESCGKTSRVHGHHYRGYLDDARLDVRWLCPPCHKAAHR